ncbi:hypothetical protein NIES267_38650 [Calothrix parasitica NIES-267]|uniref:Uncharacterized protein n=1 Tax=Calothrix parasitica NIES-267 TaxID=1973488 RepID=A0A1Z4LT03_9CYAN|nr:hypothetical protein NIES267_38650 [Calothrix parasitica NIES-267]
MNLFKNIDKFLKLVLKLPIILQALLLPVLGILWLISVLFSLFSLIPFIVFYCGKPFFKGFVKDFLEQKNQEINRITNKLEKIYDKAILQIETLDKIDNALGNNASPPTQYEIAKSIETFQKSKQGLQNANAEFDEAVKSFFDDNPKSKLSPKLPIWILSKLREDWRRDIVEKRSSDINSGCTGVVLQLKTIKYLMEMYWANLIIKIQDYRYGDASNKSTKL